MSVLASFYGHSMQARVSLDEGTSVEEMPPPAGLWEACG